MNYGLRWEAELPRREINNKMNSFDPLAINPVSGTPGVVTFAGSQRHAGTRVRDRLRTTSARASASPISLTGSGRTVLRGGTGSSTARRSATRSATRRRSASPPPRASSCRRRPRRARSGCATGSPPTRGRRLPPASARCRSAAPEHRGRRSSIRTQVAPTSYQANLDFSTSFATGSVVEIGYIGNISRHLTGERLLAEPGGAGADGPGRHAAAASVPAVQQRHADQSVDRQLQLSRRLRPRARSASPTASRSCALHASRFMDDVESANEYGVDGQLHGRVQSPARLGAKRQRRADHFVLTVALRDAAVHGQPRAGRARSRIGGSACSKRCSPDRRSR